MMIANTKGGVEKMSHKDAFTAFRLMEYDAEDERDIKRWLNMNGKTFQAKDRVGIAVLECITQVATKVVSAATSGNSLERDAEDTGGSERAARSHALEELPELPETLAEFERERSDTHRDPVLDSGCTYLVGLLSRMIVNKMDWNNVDTWRVKAETELIDTCTPASSPTPTRPLPSRRALTDEPPRFPADLEELMLILARMDTLRVTGLALKELLCTVSLYQTYWEYRTPVVLKEYNSGPENHGAGKTKPTPLHPTPGYLIEPYADVGDHETRVLLSLGLTHIVQTSKMATSREYYMSDSPDPANQGSDDSLLVDNMLEQLDRVKENMRQALQAQIAEATLQSSVQNTPDGELTTEQREKEERYTAMKKEYDEQRAKEHASMSMVADETAAKYASTQVLRLEALHHLLHLRHLHLHHDRHRRLHPHLPHNPHPHLPKENAARGRLPPLRPS